MNHDVLTTGVLSMDMEGETPLKCLMIAGGILYMQNQKVRKKEEKILLNTKENINYNHRDKVSTSNNT